MRVMGDSAGGANDAKVHAFFATPDDIDGEADAAACRATLCDAERRRCDAFLFARDRAAYLAAHALLRNTLSLYAPVAPRDWRFVHNAFGRPEIARGFTNRPLRFSLSHTHGLAMVAVTLGRAIGADVEELRASVTMEDVVAQAFSDAEARDLASLPPTSRRRRFFEYWTLKESYIKAIGTGLSTPPHLVGFEWRNGTPSMVLDRAVRDDARAWTIFPVAPTPRHVAAVALRVPSAGRAQIVVRRATPMSPTSGAWRASEMVDTLGGVA
jgi:4'-phosphopantetheinyl transferase